MLRVAALIINLPNKPAALFAALRPIKRAGVEENGDLAILLDALDQFIRYDESNPNRFGMNTPQDPVLPSDFASFALGSRQQKRHARDSYTIAGVFQAQPRTTGCSASQRGLM